MSYSCRLVKLYSSGLGSAGSVLLAGIYRPRWSIVEWFESVLDSGYIGEFGGPARRPFVLGRGSSSSLASGYNLVGHQGGQVDRQHQQTLHYYSINSKFVMQVRIRIKKTYFSGLDSDSNPKQSRSWYQIPIKSLTESDNLTKYL